jgi:hypothetical protein
MTNRTCAELENAKQGVIPSQCVRLSDETAHVGVPRRGAGEPKIDLIRAGDKILAIDVTCTCGQRIRLRCDYTS